ncbi:hypothetical protein ACVWYF_003640 [Hymenobacter sp. UYAg731]
MQHEPIEFRDLMPEGFVPLLAKATGLTDPSAISKLVRYPNPKSKHWPHAAALAQKTNPEGFARWEAAHAEPQAA